MKNADKLIWDDYCQVEVTIDRPARDVWPFLFGNKREIWSKKQFTAIAGEPGQVGEVHTMEHRGGRLFDKAITVEPEKRLVLKLTFERSETDEAALVAYDIFTLNEVAERTTLTLQQAFSIPLEPGTDIKLEVENHIKVMQGIFQHLKSTIEAINRVGSR